MPKLKPILITGKKLRAHGACSDETTRFTKLFPKGLPITESSLERVREKGFDLHRAVFDIAHEEAKARLKGKHGFALELRIITACAVLAATNGSSDYLFDALRYALYDAGLNTEA